MLMDTITFLSGADHHYDLAGSTLQTPGDGDRIMAFKATRAFQLPTNIAGSVIDAETLPTSLATMTVTKNDVSIGTITVNNAGTVTPTIAPTSFAIGDRIEIIMTTADGIDEVYVTLKTLAA